jgi:ADP-ribosylglycohydrolase
VPTPSAQAAAAAAAAAVMCLQQQRQHNKPDFDIDLISNCQRSKDAARLEQPEQNMQQQPRQRYLVMLLNKLSSSCSYAAALRCSLLQFLTATCGCASSAALTERWALLVTTAAAAGGVAGWQHLD